MIFALVCAAAYTAWITRLRRATRRNRAAVDRGDTRFVVQMSQRVRDQL